MINLVCLSFVNNLKIAEINETICEQIKQLLVKPILPEGVNIIN